MTPTKNAAAIDARTRAVRRLAARRASRSPLRSGSARTVSSRRIIVFMSQGS
jgi:hypothetical protein